MKHARDALPWLRDTLLRMLPHATRPGLFPIGNPGRDAPVLCTGNFALTVRRLKDSLAGMDAWLLVVNSRGINVWCAAGGGHLTHHDVIAALRAFGVKERVDHRTLVLPQLCATGVERRAIREATGWEPTWGPARLEDLRGFIGRGLRVKKQERRMRFPLWERFEMALMWFAPTSLIAALVLSWVVSPKAALAAVIGFGAHVFGLFALLPWLRVTGRLRFLTHALFAVLGFLLSVVVLWGVRSVDPSSLVGLAAMSAVGMTLLWLDLAGTTPWYPSSINSMGNQYDVELLEDRCTGSAQCVLVCPRDVLKMNGQRRKVAIVAPERCIRCGACIVQCPEDALRFRFQDGRVVDPATVRSTHLNLLGRRSSAP